ncbi:MAG TPA: hypothetical protein VGD91_12990, partial [Trebonia sp.]
AEAGRVRAQAEIARAQADAELARQRSQDRRADAAQRQARSSGRRQAAGAAVRRWAMPVVAIGAPAVIAWSGQYRFGADVMHLGYLAPLLPIAIEGSVLYSAKLAHTAIGAGLPAGRYRAVTWLLAFVAAGLNLWHGSAAGLQVGICLGLTSLMGIGLLELTVALRQRTAAGRTAHQLRQALIRRVRYPRLSVQAAAIAAARGVDAEQAWTAAWIDRYGIGPDSSRRDRRTARAILARQAKDAQAAARDGVLVLTDGAIVWTERSDTPAAPSTGERSPEHPDRDRSLERPGGERSPGGVWVESSPGSAYVEGGIAEFEEYLTDQATAHGTTRELPQGHRDERSPEAAGERSNTGTDPVADQTTGGGERSPRRRLSGHGDRIVQVRRLLDERPGMSGADIAAALRIPESSARRLRAKVLRERGER